MSTWFNTQCGNGKYQLQFETENREFYLRVQEAARRCVDEDNNAAALKIIETNPNVAELVKQNSGYCPCLTQKTEDTKCMCRDFQEQKEPGPCHCGRFEKVEDKR